jgi:hypothetical protein
MAHRNFRGELVRIPVNAPSEKSSDELARNGFSERAGKLAVRLAEYAQSSDFLAFS